MAQVPGVGRAANLAHISKIVTGPRPGIFDDSRVFYLTFVCQSNLLAPASEEATHVVTVAHETRPPGEEFMKIRTSVVVVLMGLFALGGTTLGADEMTLTGAVGDADCGVTHQMPGTSASCTLAGIANGSDYALIVDDTAYTLKTSSDEAKAQLEELAGQTATITGDVTDTTITVASVKAAE